jgi:hypothetical protein
MSVAINQTMSADSPHEFSESRCARVSQVMRVLNLRKYIEQAIRSEPMNEYRQKKMDFRLHR